MRTIVELPDDQIQALKRLSERSRLSRAELMRRAVAAYLRQQAVEEGAEAFGLWRDRRRDGVVYERRLREEWQ